MFDTGMTTGPKEGFISYASKYFFGSFIVLIIFKLSKMQLQQSMLFDASIE